MHDKCQSAASLKKAMILLQVTKKNGEFRVNQVENIAQDY